jgi:tetratricopeptide (TPR) repeat protein
VKPKFKANAAIAPQSKAHSKAAVARAAHVQRLLMQALAHHQQGQMALAEIGYEQVLAIDPQHFDALHMLGVLASQTQQAERAVDLIQHAIRSKPGVAGAYINLGVALRQLQRFEEALACYDQALQLEPQDAQTHTNRGVALRSLHRHTEALESYNTALRLAPHMAEAHYNRGLVRNDLNLLSEAVQDFEATLQLRPSYHPALWAKALCLLQLAEFAQAWPLYALRWQQDEKEFTTPTLRSSVPVWQPGSNPKRLLVWPEQGVGDELMFGALLPQAQQLCHQLLVQMDGRLIPLFERAMPGITFVPKLQPVDEALYDAHMPMGDLASVFCQTAQSYQAIQPAYVKADPARVQALRAQLSPDGQRLCGISWRSKNHKKGLDRSLPLSELLLALNAPGVRFVNLQYGDVGEELAKVQQSLGIEVVQCQSVDNQHDLDGLAALIQACDLVVSADNSTVHLAGALGQTVWVLLPLNADWRWLLERNDSLWYPSAKLFRQTQLADWQAVLACVGEELQQRWYAEP